MKLRLGLATVGWGWSCLELGWLGCGWLGYLGLGWPGLMKAFRAGWSGVAGKGWLPVASRLGLRGLDADCNGGREVPNREQLSSCGGGPGIVGGGFGLAGLVGRDGWLGWLGLAWAGVGCWLALAGLIGLVGARWKWLGLGGLDGDYKGGKIGSGTVTRSSDPPTAERAGPSYARFLVFLEAWILSGLELGGIGA